MGIQINGNTNNINAGIGSLSIEDIRELDIIGVATASNFKTGSSNLHSTGLTVGNNFLHSTGINVGTGATIHVPATNVLTLGTNSNERLRIRSDGNIGINNVGDANWKLKLVVPDNSSYQTAFNVTNNTNSDFNVVIKSNLTAIGSGTNTPLAFFTNGNANERLRITSGGQLNIGTDLTNSTYLISSRGTGHNRIEILSTDNNSAGIYLRTFNSGSQVSSATVRTDSSGNLQFYTAASGTEGERLRIDSSGRVQIGGVTGPNNAKLFVAGTNSTNYITMRNTSAGDGSGARWNSIRFQGTQSGGEVSDLVQLQANHDGTADDQKGSFQVLVNDGNDGDSLQERLRINSTGNVSIGGLDPVPTSTSYNSASLHIHQTTNAANVGAQIHLTTANKGSAAGDGAQLSQYNGNLYINNQDDGNMYFLNNSNSTIRMTITSGGALGFAGANYGTSGQVLTSQGASSAPQWASASGGVTVSGNANNRIITGDGTNLVGENLFQYDDSNGTVTLTAPEGGDASLVMNADENDDMHDRYKLVSGADNHFQMYQMSSGGGWESRVKFHSARGNIEPIHDTIGLHGGGVVVAQCNTSSGSSSDSPNFKVDFTVPMGDMNSVKYTGAREGFASSGETGSTINPHGGSGILIASNFGNYYWGFATKIYHISSYASYHSGSAVSLNQLHSYTGAGHGANASHITLSVQSNPANSKTTPTLRATFGGDYWSSNYLVVTFVGSGVASYANLRSLSHINSSLTGQDTAYK